MTPLLSGVIRISHPRTAAAKVASSRQDIFVPAQSFRARSVVTRDVEGIPGPGRLTFTVKSPYANPRAEGVWQYRVTLDGLIVSMWDGALATGPVTVSLSGVSGSSRIQLQIHVRKDRLNMPSWERASRAFIEDVHFEAEADAVDRYPRAREETEVVAAEHVRRFTVPTCDVAGLQSLAPDLFPWDEPTRLDVLTPHCIIPLLIVRRPAVSRTLVLANGAVDLERSQSAPIFQRSTWWRDLPTHQIYVCDPATTGEGALSLAWCQVTRNYWAVPDISRAVMQLSKIMGLSQPEDRLYFGSSAGGFVAAALTLHDDGSSALVNNAQFDWTRWMAGAVNALRSATFDNLTPAQLRSTFPQRTNIFRLATSRNARSSIDYVVNMESSHDTQVDLPIARDFLRVHSDSPTRLRIHPYRDAQAGHNPLGKEETIARLVGLLTS